MKKQSRIFSNFKYFFIFALIVFIIIECIVLSVFYTNTRIEADNIGQRSLFEAEEVVNPIFKENEKFVYLLASDIDDMLVEDISTDDVQAYLTSLSKSYREEIDPNFFGAFGVVDGVYINGEGFIPDSDYIPSDRPWYIAAADAKGHVGITKPYTDLQTGMPVLSFSKLLSDNRGVIAIDISLNDVREITKKISTEGIEAVYIADADCDIVAHSMEEFIGLNFKTNPSSDEEMEFSKTLHANENKSFEMKLRGNNCVVFNSTLQNGWSVVVIVDLVKEFYGRREAIVLFSLILLLSFMGIIYSAYNYDIRRRSAENLTIQLKAASAIYRSVHLLDFEKDTIQELNSMNDIHSVIGDLSKGISNSLNGALRYFVTDELYQPLILEFADINTLDERMQGKLTITQEFIGSVSGWCRARFIAVEYNDNHMLKKVLFAVEIIDEEKRLENQLRYLSEMDGLTGITNRTTGERMIKELMAGGKEGMFCLMDADKFKSINDTFGHGVGDKVLTSIANSLKESFRDRDVVFRLGGDEFAVFAVGATEEDAADRMISRFFESIDKISIPEMKGQKVNISLGATFYRVNSGIGFDELYNKADEGMYKSKKSEGNCYILI